VLMIQIQEKTQEVKALQSVFRSVKSPIVTANVRVNTDYLAASKLKSTGKLIKEACQLHNAKVE